MALGYGSENVCGLARQAALRLTLDDLWPIVPWGQGYRKAGSGNLQETNLPDPDEIALEARVRVPEHVLFQEVAGHAALLNMQSELYFGLDDVGTRMWKELAAGPTIETVATRLVAAYDGPPEQIRSDLVDLVRELKKHGLVELDR
jgi:hypothetical protein